jgi:hypothetical protein
MNNPMRSLEGVNGDSPLFWNAMGQLASAVKTIAPNKLVSVAITDLPGPGRLLGSVHQHYRLLGYAGISRDQLRHPDHRIRPSQFQKTAYHLPSFGYDALDGGIDEEWPNNAERPANAIEALWNELRADDAGADIIAGACVFEYADEWWKDQPADDPDNQDFGPRWPGPFEDGQGNEEWWGIFRISNAQPGVDIDTLTPRALFYRLAAMWNEPFETTLFSGKVGADVEVSFTYPLHLRDQKFGCGKISSSLSGWESVADNVAGTDLVSTDASVSLSSVVVDDSVHVTLLKNPGSPGNRELLVNPGFETGTVEGWLTGGTIASSNPHEGLYNLEISAPGAGLVPAAFQSFPAKEGDDITLSGYLYTATPLPVDNSTFGLFKIVFKDRGWRRPRTGSDPDRSGWTC